MARLTDAQLREAAAAFNAVEGNQIKAAASLGVARETIQNRVRIARATIPGLVKDWPLAKGGTPKQDKPERTLDEDVALSRAQQNDRFSQARLKDALREMARLQDELENLRFASTAGFTPAEWTLAPRKGAKSEHTPYLLTSDFQCGEVIRADETEAGYGYDSEIFRRRYRMLIQATIDLCLGHGGQHWSYPGIIYARGGDAISGGIHEELADTDDMTPIEAVQCVFEEESAGIHHLADAFGKVEVKSPDAAGNHDRNTHKPRSKNAAGHSYDLMISFMLQREFRNDKRVTFQTSRSFDVMFPVYEKNILLTHGDRMGSGGGQGFIGPAATMLRGAQKVIAEQASLGRHIDQVHIGHFHTPLVYDFLIGNGCLPGYSEYAKSFRMRPTDPQQFLIFYHPTRGLVDIRPVNLRDA
jgi:hypothetical protein